MVVCRAAFVWWLWFTRSDLQNRLMWKTSAVWEPENREFISNENIACYRIFFLFFLFFFVKCGICLGHMKLFRLLFFKMIVYIFVIWKIGLGWYYTYWVKVMHNTQIYVQLGEMEHRKEWRAVFYDLIVCCLVFGIFVIGSRS